MKAAFATAIVAASVASAQNLGALSGVLGQLSSGCQVALLGLLTNSSAGSLGQCLNLPALLPVITNSGNTSIIPQINSYLTTTCSSAPCTNATLNSAAQTVSSGCSSELSQYGVSNTTVYDIMAQYPLAREVLCLKTTEPRNLTNSSIPISQFNSTNGTFCVSSLLDDFTGYTGINLTIPTITSEVMSFANGTGNSSVFTSIPPTALCSDCIFAAVSLIEEEFPQLSNQTIVGGNFTINSYLNQTCPSTNYNYTISTNGTLPATIIDTDNTTSITNGTSSTSSISALSATAASTASAVGATTAAPTAARRGLRFAREN